MSRTLRGLSRAFPRPFSWDESPSSGMHTGDRPAYHDEQDGMTLREYYAGKMLAALIAAGGRHPPANVKAAVCYADELIDELSK
jgi:hypothetical protein